MWRGGARGVVTSRRAGGQAGKFAIQLFFTSSFWGLRLAIREYSPPFPEAPRSPLCYDET